MPEPNTDQPFHWTSPDSDEYRLDLDGNTYEFRGENDYFVPTPTGLVAELLRQRNDLRKEWEKLRDSLVEIQNVLYTTFAEEVEMKVEDIASKALAPKERYIDASEDNKETKP